MAWPDSDYPGSYDAPPDPDSTLDGTPLHSELHLFAHDAIEKMQQTLGTSPPLTLAQAATKVDRLATHGTTGAGGTTSGTTPLTAMTLTFNAPAAGRIIYAAHLALFKSDDGDRFDVAAQIDGGGNQAVAIFWPNMGVRAQFAFGFEAGVSSGNHSVTVTVTRNSGTGTCTVDSAGGRIKSTALYIPS